MKKSEMLSEIVERACAEPSLVEALAWAAVWETDRAVKQALEWQSTGVSTAGHGGSHDTCFGILFGAVEKCWLGKRGWGHDGATDPEATTFEVGDRVQQVGRSGCSCARCSHSLSAAGTVEKAKPSGVIRVRWDEPADPKVPWVESAGKLWYKLPTGGR